jgi:hypothetical protein
MNNTTPATDEGLREAIEQAERCDMLPRLCATCGPRIMREARAALATPVAPLDVEAIREHLVPWWRVRGDEALAEGVMRRCLVCGRTSKIVDDLIAISDVHHEADCAVAALLRAAALQPASVSDSQLHSDAASVDIQPAAGEGLREAQATIEAMHDPGDRGAPTHAEANERGYQPGDGARVAMAYELADARATIEAMSGDAADLHDLIGEAAAMRTVLGHVLVRTHDSGCGTCDAARALLTAEHELPSRAALQPASEPPTKTESEVPEHG